MIIDYKRACMLADNREMRRLLRKWRRRFGQAEYTLVLRRNGIGVLRLIGLASEYDVGQLVYRAYR